MLKSIETKKCPICGCTSIIEERVEITDLGKKEIKEHCTGTRWEHRKFLCGYEIQYEPNFFRETVGKNSECDYDPNVIAKRKKEKEDEEKLINLLIKNDIDEELIKKIKLYCL